MRGFITKSISGIFYVYCEDDEKTYTCKVRGQIRNLKYKPICGDEVIFEYDASADFALILEILPRKNELIRPPICNIDIALIVMSTIKPNFDSYLVDKLLVLTRMQAIEPIIIVSKCEFITPEIESLIANYRLAGYQVIEVSSKENINIAEVIKNINGKKVVLCGQSAVGKSSLINAISETKIQEVGNFSEKLGRGKHQTRVVEYLKIGGAYVADSPGFSSLEFKMDLCDLARAFKDFDKYANNCKFNTCLHDNEPCCAVKDAVNQGLIDKRRYQNYLHLKNEIKDGRQIWVKK